MSSVTIISILRLRELVTFSSSTNPSWDQLDLAYWSTVELNVGIICTCLPSIRLILLRLFPRIIGSSISRNKSYEDRTEGYEYPSNTRTTSTNDHALSDLEASSGRRWTRISK